MLIQYVYFLQHTVTWNNYTLILITGVSLITWISTPTYLHWSPRHRYPPAFWDVFVATVSISYPHTSFPPPTLSWWSFTQTATDLPVVSTAPSDSLMDVSQKSANWSHVQNAEHLNIFIFLIGAPLCGWLKLISLSICLSVDEISRSKVIPLIMQNRILVQIMYTLPFSYLDHSLHKQS